MKILLILIVLFLLPNNVRANESRRNTNAKEIRKISWYARGLRDPSKFTPACWNRFPKGTRFKVSYNARSIVIVCDDRGEFEFNKSNVFLDLSSGAFSSLSDLRKGIIYAQVEIIK